MAFREVTMLEVKEILRLWLRGVPKKRIAQQLGFDVKTVRRYLDAARARGVEQAHGLAALDDELVAAVVAVDAARDRPPARRRVGRSARRTATSSRGTSTAACGSPRSASCSGGTGSRSRTRRCAASRSQQLGFGRAAPDRAGRRLRAGAGGPGRHGLDDAARARRVRQAPALPRLDLHRGPLAPSLRLPGVPGDDRDGDRGVRGGLGVLRRRLPRRHPRQHQGDRRGGRPDRAEDHRRLPRVRAGARLRHRHDPRAPPEGQGARRADGADRARRLLRRRAAAHPRRRPRPRLAAGASTSTG